MKRFVVELVALYADLLQDAGYAYPTLRADFARDLQRITHLASQRGLPFFMVDLPNLGKHLDRCLSVSQYTQSGLPVSRRAPNCVGIPVLFRGLYLLIFEPCGDLKANCDLQAILFLRTLLRCAKKAKVECSEADTASEIAEFVRLDTEDVTDPPLSSVDPTYDNMIRDFKGFAADEVVRGRVVDRLGKRGVFLLRVLDRVAAELSLTLGNYDFREWRFKHGPGAVSNVRKDQDRYVFPDWSEQLERAFPWAEAGHYSLSSWADRYWGENSKFTLPRRDMGFCGDRDDPPSRLVAVKKTLRKPRLIASEPAENMWCQQNLRHFMYTRTANSWLSSFVTYRSQARNQELALRGSVDGSLATLDLSAASDRVSCQAVGNLFRANLPLLQALLASRSRRCELPNGVVHEVRKYSTMGNATTFPVQTSLFLCVALACCIEERGSLDKDLRLSEYEGKVSIFGDDIIVPTKVVGTVIALLESLGLKVNTDKSFFEGNFRESCGVDAFRGVDVTPVYWQGVCDGKPESIASAVEVSNNLYRKFFVEAAAGVEARARGRIKLPMCALGSGVLGYESFCVPPPPFKRRWNKDLQRVEYRLPALIAKVETNPTDNDTSLLQWFTESPSRDTPWKHGIRGRPLVRISKRWVPATQLEKPSRTAVNIGDDPAEMPGYVDLHPRKGTEATSPAWQLVHGQAPPTW